MTDTYHLDAAMRTLHRAKRYGEDTIDQHQAQALLERIAQLERLEKWTRWWMELPDVCWSGFHMRAHIRIRDALTAIAPLKVMEEKEISPRTKAIESEGR